MELQRSSFPFFSLPTVKNTTTNIQTGFSEVIINTNQWMTCKSFENVNGESLMGDCRGAVSCKAGLVGKTTD